MEYCERWLVVKLAVLRLPGCMGCSIEGMKYQGHHPENDFTTSFTHWPRLLELELSVRVEVFKVSVLWVKGNGTRVDAKHWPSRDGQALSTIQIRQFSFSYVAAYVGDLGGDNVGACRVEDGQSLGSGATSCSLV